MAAVMAVVGTEAAVKAEKEGTGTRAGGLASGVGSMASSCRHSRIRE